MKHSTIATLFARAAGRCSICRAELIYDNVRIGEMAHVISEKLNGPRGEYEYALDFDDYENLILLCPSHHSIVDGRLSKKDYPPQKLHRIKSAHELWVANTLKSSSKRSQDVVGLQAFVKYSQLTNVRSWLHNLPHEHNLGLTVLASCFDEFEVKYPQCSPFEDVDLEKKYQRFREAYFEYSEILNEHYVSPDYEADFVLLDLRELEYEDRRDLLYLASVALDKLRKNYEDFFLFIRTNYREVDLMARPK